MSALATLHTTGTYRVVPEDPSVATAYKFQLKVTYDDTDPNGFVLLATKYELHVGCLQLSKDGFVFEVRENEENTHTTGQVILSFGLAECLKKVANTNDFYIATWDKTDDTCIKKKITRLDHEAIKQPNPNRNTYFSTNIKVADHAYTQTQGERTYVVRRPTTA